MVYASKYYDPVKRHEYYMKHRKLKGRKGKKRGSVASLNDKGKAAAAEVKERLNAEIKEKLAELPKRGATEERERLREEYKEKYYAELEKIKADESMKRQKKTKSTKSTKTSAAVDELAQNILAKTENMSDEEKAKLKDGLQTVLEFLQGGKVTTGSTGSSKVQEKHKKQMANARTVYANNQDMLDFIDSHEEEWQEMADEGNLPSVMALCREHKRNPQAEEESHAQGNSESGTGTSGKSTASTKKASERSGKNAAETETEYKHTSLTKETKSDPDFSQEVLQKSERLDNSGVFCLVTHDDGSKVVVVDSNDKWEVPKDIDVEALKENIAKFSEQIVSERKRFHQFEENSDNEVLEYIGDHYNEWFGRAIRGDVPDMAAEIKKKFKR